MNEDHRPTAQTTRRDSFVVRIWRERDQPGWQGWVQHAGTGESASVRRIDELVEKEMGSVTGGMNIPGLKLPGM